MNRVKYWIYNHWISGRIPLAIWRDMKQTLGTQRLFRHMLETLSPDIRKYCTFDHMDYVVDDLDYSPNDEQRLTFEHMAGLFLNCGINSGIISQPFRQAAYLFHTVRNISDSYPNYQMLEIGRYRGGTTFLLASALYGNGGDVISIDNRSVETRLEPGHDYDLQLKYVLQRYGLAHKVKLITMDSTEAYRLFKHPVFDGALIDGDHHYNSVMADIQLALYGIPKDLFFDDTTDALTGGPSDVWRAIQTLLDTGHWMVKKRIMRMVHLERKSC